VAQPLRQRRWHSFTATPVAQLYGNAGGTACGTAFTATPVAENFEGYGLGFRVRC